MIKNLLLFTLLFINFFLTAQEWTEPINISNMEGTDYLPDITVSPDGILHCVWTHFYNSNHREIFYSYSSDEGNNWSTPVSISQNDTMAMSRPHIVADSENNLYVTYEYNVYSPFVAIQKYDGISWSERDTVVYDYSHHNKIYIDNNDKIYVFFSRGDSKIHYKYLQNNIWSEVITPFDVDDFNSSIMSATIDNNNDLHIIGYYQYIIAYYKYNSFIDQWDLPEILSENTYFYNESDISVDTEGNPYLVWHEYRSDTESFEHATFYNFYNGTNWSTPELIAENAYGQLITNLDNKVYIMDAETEPNDKMSLVLYQQDSYGNWYGNKFFICDGLNGLKMLRYGNKLFIIFYWYFNGVDLDISIIQTKYGVGIDEIENISSIFTLNQNFPNPVYDYTQIKYSLNKSGYCTLNIYNIEGKLVNTLVSKEQQVGNYTIEWNGKNTNGIKLLSGIYFYRLSLDNLQITRSLILN